MVVSLYTSRLILQVLGFADHGIYNLIGSVVVMFNMFSATFVASTQRFLNFALGKNDYIGASKVFSASVNIHALIALLIIILLETIGLWFLNCKLNIPSGRLFAANIVYQCSVITFVINLFCIPFNAVIIAKEKMHIYALISIYESIAKLFIVIALSYLAIDRLVLYGVMLMLVSISILLFYLIYCGKKYGECRYAKVNDCSLYKEILGISGWNFLGSSATILTVSGMGVIINLFTDVVVNSAKGIASQVESIVKQLVDNFMMSIRPQITKSYALGDSDYLLSLISRGSRFSLYLMAALCFPIIINVDYILSMWLGNVPVYTSQFIIFTLLYIMIIPFSNILDNLLMAAGKIKKSQIYLSLLQLCNLPLSCILLYFEFKPYLIYLSYIIISYLSLSVRIHYSAKYANLNVKYYLSNILIKPILVIVFSFVLSYILVQVIKVQCQFIEFIITSLIIELILLLCCFLFGISKQEKIFIYNLFKFRK